MKNAVRIYLTGLIVLIAVSCTSVENTGETLSPMSMQRGLRVFKTHCFACHQISGNGVERLYPPLANNKTVNGDKTALIKIILNGMSGEVTINGKKYNQVMIPHNFLSDEQIADVLTYTRNSFGNQSSQVTPEEVKKVRHGN